MNRGREYFRVLLYEQHECQLAEKSKVEGPLEEITEEEVKAASANKER